MKLAEKSRQKLENFFREYYKDEDFKLPLVYFYIGGFTKIFTGLIHVQGITLGSRVYIFPELVMTTSQNKPKLPERLAAHEITHVLQYKKYGFTKFLIHYLRCYWENLKTQEKWDLRSRQQAYHDIPFEIEAREVENCFARWCEKKRCEM